MGDTNRKVSVSITNRLRLKVSGFKKNDYLRMRSLHSHVCREYVRNSQVTVVRTIKIDLLQSSLQEQRAFDQVLYYREERRNNAFISKQSHKMYLSKENS